MTLDIPFEHSASVVAKGHRNAVRRSFCARTRLEMAEHEAAATAFRIVGARSGRPDVRTVLSVSGKLWSGAAWPDAIAPITAAEFKALLAKREKSPRNPLFPVQSPSGGYIVDIAMDRFEGHIVETDRATREAAVRRSAEDWCFIAGTMRRVMPEPVYHVIRASDGKPSVIVADANFPSERMSLDTEIFRADQFDAAIARGRDLGKISGHVEVHVEAAIEVLDPSMVRFDEKAASMLRAAKLAAEYRLKADIHDLDVEHAAIARALASGRPDGSTATAVKGVADWLGAHGLREHAVPLQRALERWPQRQTNESAPRHHSDGDVAIFDPAGGTPERLSP